MRRKKYLGFRRAKLIRKNKIRAMNKRAVTLTRYITDVVAWTKNEPEERNRKTRKVMKVNKELQPKSDNECF